MGEVIQFPEKITRDWAEMQTHFKALIQTTHASDEVAEEILAQIKPLFDILNGQISFALNSDITRNPDIIDSINNALAITLKELANRILLERIEREMRVCGQIGLFD